MSSLLTLITLSPHRDEGGVNLFGEAQTQEV